MRFAPICMVIFSVVSFTTDKVEGRKKESKDKKQPHHLEVLQYIRNRTAYGSGDLRPEKRGNNIGQRVAVTRMAENGRRMGQQPERAPGQAADEQGHGNLRLSTETTEMVDLRHADMASWKKEKKAVRLAVKKYVAAGGQKPLGDKGITRLEYAALAEEVNQGGRYARVPCTPPHCVFRCEIQDECKRHPLMDEWQPPKPRECGEHQIWPISFGIPASEVVDCVPYKGSDFATVVPYREKSYVFGPADEAEYKRDYRKARFGITREKAGWDCMRHYEILAAGSVPIFLDIDKAPSGVMPFLPKKLLSHIRHQPAFSLEGCDMKHPLGKCNFWLDEALFDQKDYDSAACSLLEHTKARLTTRALAEYALRAAGIDRGQWEKATFRALYLGGTAHNSDYLRDLMFHGFRDLLGDKVFEYNTPRYMYEWPSDTPSNSALQNPNKHWGK